MNVTDRKKAKKTKLEVFKKSTLHLRQWLVFVDASDVCTKWTEEKKQRQIRSFSFLLLYFSRVDECLFDSRCLSPTHPVSFLAQCRTYYCDNLDGQILFSWCGLLHTKANRTPLMSKPLETCTSTIFEVFRHQDNKSCQKEHWNCLSLLLSILK